jgi:hypothetical protein
LDTGCVNAKGKVDVLNFIDEMEKQSKLETCMINVTGDEIKSYKNGYQKYLSRRKELQYGLVDIGEFDRSVFNDNKIMILTDSNTLFFFIILSSSLILLISYSLIKYFKIH